MIYSERINKLLTMVLLWISMIFMVGCQGTTNPQIDSSAVQQQDISIKRTELIHQIFYNLPSPIEMANIIQKSNVNFSQSLLSIHGREKEFLTQDYLALNLGVYGADLSYCRVFDQIQESIKYLSSIRNITQALQIPQEYNNDAVERLEKNLSNRDSLVSVVVDLFTNADTYLKENQREGTAVLILVGSWVEGMYISTRLVPDIENRIDLMGKIADQKHSAKNLVKLYNLHKHETALKQRIFEELVKIDLIFDEVSIEQGANEVNVDTQNKKTLLKVEGSLKMTKETFSKLKNKLAEIRAIIIKEKLNLDS